MDETTKIIAGFILGLVILITILLMVISSLRKKMRKLSSQAEEDVKAARLHAESEIASAQKSAKSEIASIRTACENEKQAMSDKCNETINSIRKEYENQIRHVKEDIESNKATLSKMNEKDLLVNIMMALNGYAGRVDRIEQYFTDNPVVDQINRLLVETTKAISDICDDTNESIQSSLNDSDIVTKLDDIYSAIEDTKSDLNDSDIETKLDNIYSIIDDTRSDVCDTYNLCNGFGIYDIKDGIDSIQSKVDEIEYSIGQDRNYNSTSFYSLDDIMSVVNEIKDIAESARDAAESAKDTVESHFY